ncbi:MAG: HupE/UreJ family protein [Acidimicrobiales bacterium]
MALFALAILVLSTMWALPASAHRGNQSYLYLDVGPTDLNGRVELPYTDVREAFGLVLEQPVEVLLAELEANLDMLHDYVSAHSSVGADGQVWNMTFEGVELLGDGTEDGDEPGYVIFPFEVDVPGAEVPRQLDVTFDPFFDEIDNRDAIVLIANDWQRGVFEEEANELLVTVPNNRSGTLDLGDPSQWLNFTGSIDLGINHIRTGPDHVFFVLVLLLPSALVFAAAWRPAPSFGSALWRVLKIVSMFTLAHSITFTLAGLDIIPLPPSKLVETIIAVSIVAAALHNLRPIFHNREWLMAFAFGLFHGLGFASLVEALDTSRTTQLISLLGRNVGIEIGHAVVILLTFPALFLLRRTRYYRPLFVVGSIMLALISIVWAAERIFEFDLGTTDLVVLAIKWPRSLIVMVLATVVAGLVFKVEESAGRLEPIAETDSVSAEPVTV